MIGYDVDTLFIEATGGVAFAWAGGAISAVCSVLRGVEGKVACFCSNGNALESKNDTVNSKDHGSPNSMKGHWGLAHVGSVQEPTNLRPAVSVQYRDVLHM